MKLNNKGFAVSIVLYSVSAIIIVVLLLILAVDATTVHNVRNQADKIKEELSMPKSSCNYTDGDVVASFNYANNAQTFIVPCDGMYKLEVWGSQGGTTNGAVGGKGGYAHGNIVFYSGTVLTINNGSNSNHTSGNTKTFTSPEDAFGKVHTGTQYIAAGGTSTSIYNGTTLLIMAGGGGGGAYGTDSVDGSFSVIGGSGGGTTGTAGASNNFAETSGYILSLPTGGTQSASGSNATIVVHLNSTTYYGGAGGGYYRGGNGALGSFRGYAITSGAGGSGYIGGVTDGVMTNGVREGNGYARITLISLN